MDLFIPGHTISVLKNPNGLRQYALSDYPHQPHLPSMSLLLRAILMTCNFQPILQKYTGALRLAAAMDQIIHSQ